VVIVPKKKRPALVAKNSMMALGIYKPQFDPVIEIYGQLVEQYEILSQQFIDSGYNFSEDTNTGTKKAPIVTTLETLRKDILAYSVQLGLTSAALKHIKEESLRDTKKSGLAEALERLNDE